MQNSTVYVDDIRAMSKSNQVIDQLATNLKQKGYMLIDVGILRKYLGVDIR